MQGRTNFVLILKDNFFLIPSNFQALHDVNPYIYHTLINHYQYKVKSDVPEYIFKSFIDHWVKNKIQIINNNDLNYYEQLSHEFDRMKDIIQLYKKSIKNLNNISVYEDNKNYILTKNKILKRKKAKFICFIRILFNNIEQINDSCSIKIDQNHKTKSIYKRKCKKGILKSVKLLSNKLINNDGILYLLNETDRTAEIYRVINQFEEVFIPRSFVYQFQEYIVTKIDPYINEYYSIKKINLPKDSELKIISQNTFMNFGIQNVTIPSKVIEILSMAFYFCQKLTKIEFSKDSKLTYIGKKAFSRTLIESIIIPANVKSIGPKCFEDCSKLKNVYFAEHSKLHTIGIKAFSRSGLEKIILPSSVSVIKKQCFYSCNNLQEVSFCENSKLIYIEEGVFELSAIKILSIPSSVIELRNGWCKSTSNLNHIKILQNNKKRISCIDNKLIVGRANPKSDKYDCILFAPRNIEEVIIPSFIKRISSYAFSECKNLKKVSFLENSQLQIIDDFSFYNCSFKEIIIPSSVFEIGKKAFSIKELEKVTFSKDSLLTVIDSKAFAKSSLKKIFIPSSVCSIHKKAFNSCKNLSIVEFGKDSKLEIIKTKAFANTALKKISIPPHVRTLGFCIFEQCFQLQEVNFLEKSEIKKIYASSFMISSSIELTIPSSVENYFELLNNKPIFTNLKIDPKNKNLKLYKNEFILEKSNKESDVFDVIVWASKNIKKVIIPSFVKKIKIAVFHKNELLESVEFQKDSQLIEISSYSFSETSIQSITIPKHVKKICSSAFNNCKKLKNIKFDEDSELECISEFAFGNTSIEYFKFPSHIDHLDPNIFYCCKKIKTIEFSEESQIKTINNFLEGSSIENISIPSKVENFDYYWHNYLYNLKNIIISPKNKNFIYYDNEFLLGKYDKNKNIYDYLLFANDRKHLIIPSFVKIIRFTAFSICKSLKKIDFLDDSQLEIFEKYMFNDTSFEYISIPKHVKEIKENTFDSCKIKCINLTDDCELESIQSKAFLLSRISCLYIPQSVKKIKSDSFYYCQIIIVEISEKSKLYSLSYNKLQYFKYIMIPPKLSKKLFKPKKTNFF